MKLRIREWMDMRNVSQAQIAAALEVSRATVSAWVEGRPGPNGRKQVLPDLESIEGLCLFFECTPNDLFELKKRQTPSGLTWRDFSGKRGPGRPSKEKASATPSELEGDTEV